MDVYGIMASVLEAQFLLIWRATGRELPVAQYKFHPTRKWPFDFAWPCEKVAVEVQGGEWLKGTRQGRHTRGGGYNEDCEKRNAATLLGWRVFYCTGTMLRENPIGFCEMVAEALVKWADSDVQA